MKSFLRYLWNNRSNKYTVQLKSLGYLFEIINVAHFLYPWYDIRRSFRTTFDFLFRINANAYRIVTNRDVRSIKIKSKFYKYVHIIFGFHRIILSEVDCFITREFGLRGRPLKGTRKALNECDIRYFQRMIFFECACNTNSSKAHNLLKYIKLSRKFSFAGCKVCHQSLELSHILHVQ